MDNGNKFFGKGYWGKSAYWFNVPSRWRMLDELHGGHLEKFLSAVGDFSESFLYQSMSLPDQRDPYQVRTEFTNNRWFYITDYINWQDEEYGNVTRLIGEYDIDNMPAMDENNPPSEDAEVLKRDYPWFPYVPVRDVGRWWQVSWLGASYRVERTRLRNFDSENLKNENSLANEIWITGGDLSLEFNHMVNRHYTPISFGDGSQMPPFELPITPLRLTFNTSESMPWLTSKARFKVRLVINDGVGISNMTHANPCILTTSLAHGLPYSGEVYLKDMNISQLPDGYYNYTVVDSTKLLLNSLDSSSFDAYVSGGNLHEVTILYDVPDGVGENGNLYIEDSGIAGQIDTSVSYGTIDYLSGRVEIDLSDAGLFTIPGTSIDAKWIVRGYYMRFYEMPLIDYLAKDYGIENDRNDPEFAQRSAIANITQYLKLKSNQDAYRIRGEISLFNVYIRSFWRVIDSSILESIPEEHRFVINGMDYIDIQSRFIRYDDIRGDEHFYDIETASWMSLVDNNFLGIDPMRSSGVTIGQSYALDVTQGYYGLISTLNSNSRSRATINSIQALSEDDLLHYGLSGGYRVEIQMQRCQGEAFNFSLGRFALTKYDVTPPNINDEKIWIDFEENKWTISYSPTVDPQEDVGIWTIILAMPPGESLPLNVMDNVAVYYFPVSGLGRYYVKSSYVRGEIEATDEAYEHYKTDNSIDLAIERMKDKLLEIAPAHVRVKEWLVIRKHTILFNGVQNGANILRILDGDIFNGNYKVWITVDLWGDLDLVSKKLKLYVKEHDGGTLLDVWDEDNVYDGISEESWRNLILNEEIDIIGGNQIEITIQSELAMAYGKVRFSFRVAKIEV